MSDYLDANNEELLKDFFSEAEEMIEKLESNILVIESAPDNHDAIDEIFRAAHTLKGNSAAVEMAEITEFAHTMEDLLDEVRSDRVKVTGDIVDVLLESLDVIKAMLESRANGSIYGESVEEISGRIKAFINGKGAAAPAPAAAPAASPASSATPAASQPSASTAALDALTEDDLHDLNQSKGPNEKIWGIVIEFDETNPMNSVGGIQVFAALKAVGSVLKTIPDFDALYEDQFYKQVIYYIASSANQNTIEDTAFLSDVTLSVDAQCLEGKEHARGHTPTLPAATAPAPTPAPAQPAPAAAAPAPASQPAPAVATPAPAQAAPAEGDKKPAPQAKATGHQVQASSILRVDSRRIDYLLNLVSETVITKAAFNQEAGRMSEMQATLQAINSSYKDQLHSLFDSLPIYLEKIQNGAAMKDIKAQMLDDYGDIFNHFDKFEAEYKDCTGKFRSQTQNLGRIAGELQEGVMKIRMVPISQIFDRFPRVVRDLQKDLGKKINLQIEGEETELDKTVIDDLMDPIMHCVRNSVDHGVETPEVRKASGKDETGTVMLKAMNEGNLIIIEIIDDGAGINIEKVRQKAIDRGIIHPSKIITDQEAYQLIFSPGFSTADKISNVSGRGVGLDVVKTMIQKLNGTVVVTSEPGKGTKFTIKLPLTLAIIQGLLVKVGTEVYSIPVASVVESVRVKAEEINTIDNYEVLNVRNEVISILRLSRLFNIRNREDSAYCFIVIVGSQEKKIGIMVDALIGEEDVVIKPLRDQFTNSPGIAGASILGDGSVSLIIDVGQLLELGVQQEIEARKNDFE